MNYDKTKIVEEQNTGFSSNLLKGTIPVEILKQPISYEDIFPQKEDEEEEITKENPSNDKKIQTN